MRIFIKKHIRLVFTALLAVWIALWVNFIFRDLFRKGRLHDYIEAYKRNAEGKYSYVYGDRFFEFLEFSKKSMPPGSTYTFEGVEDLSIDHRRGVYYLYPNVYDKNDPDYILIFTADDFNVRRST